VTTEHEEYLRKLDEHSFTSRYDPLRDAVKGFLYAWDHEDNMEKNDLSEEIFERVHILRNVLEARER
jgi:hypothetical protein